jgi:FkbM family methyltransferase
MHVANDLIFDIGMHTGVDTQYYLELGYRVVAVEANPDLVKESRKRFSDAISDGLLVIENIGLGNQRGVLPFYVNHGTAEWSSFKKHLGARNGKFHVIEVPCIVLADLVAKHGVPYFMKVDIEGLDNAVTRDVADLPEKPSYVSIEDGGISSMLALCHAGARRFKFSNQPDVQASINESTGHVFGESSSGPFAERLPGPWLDHHEAFEFYIENVRRPHSSPMRGWWDIHGSFAK